MNLRKLFVLSYLLFGAGAGVAMDVATNVWYNSDWSGDLPWVDLIRRPVNGLTPRRTIRVLREIRVPWANEGAPSGMMVPGDSDGYPLQVPYTYNGTPYRPVTIMLCQYNIQHYPYGTFTLIFEGKGTIVLGGMHTTPLPVLPAG